MGRLVPVLAVASLLFVGLWVGPGTADVEILGYDLGVGVSEPDTVVDVAAELRLRLRPPTARIQLLFSSRAALLGIEAMVGGACMPLEAGRQAGDSLVIFLPESLRAADSLHLQLRYALPRRPLPGVTYLSRGHRWYPQLIDQIAPFRLRVDLPGGWTSFSGGDLVADSKAGTERQMVWASDMPVFKIELALAPPASVRDDSVEAGGVTFHLVSSRADTAAARQILGDATKAFSYFRSLLGEFPYRRFTVLETAEWPGTNIGSGIVVPGKPAVDAFLAGHRDELRLALACQWMGAGIFPEFMSPGYWFLQLSLPHYLRLMYVKEADGEREFENQLERSLAAYERFAGTDQDVAIAEIAMLDTPAKGAAIYGKGPYVAHRLARSLGDARWRETLRLLYGRYRGRTLTCADLCAWLDERDAAGKPGSRLQAMLSAKGLPAAEE
jgi:hypothetical protein